MARPIESQARLSRCPPTTLMYRHRHLRALVGLVAAAFVTLLFPLPAAAIEKGVQTDLTWGIDSATQDQTVAGVADLGAGWMRITMSWHDVEKKSKGSYSSSELSRYDQAINKAQQSGAKLIVTVYTAPPWASGTSERESPPLNPADYADFMRFVADRYRGKVAAWEIWNEQNAVSFWSTGPNPAHYAQIVKAAYPAVKAEDQNALVVYGGTWENDYEFLEAAYAAVPDLGNYFDVLATHPYNGILPPEEIRRDHNGRIARWVFAGYRELRQTMLNHGDDKPIWFTEFGWATYSGEWGVSEATQASYLERAYNCAQQDPYVGVGIWYIFRNVSWGNDGNNWYHQLGLTRTNFSQKLAYNAFKSWAPGAGGCTYQDPAAPAPAAASEPAPQPQPEPTVEEPAPEPEEEAASDEDADEPVSSSERASYRVRVRIVRSARAAGTTRRSSVRVVGRVKGAKRGRVVLRLQRKNADGRWVRRRKVRVRVGARGRFTKRVRRLAPGRWRVRALYRVERPGADKRTRSPLVYFRG